jgi:pimeloyl-ACP methyl ester carboxylesterase
MTIAASTVTLGSGITLSYAAQGDESGPVVVMLPGPTDSWRSYEPVLEQLPPSVRAIAVSPRGHGDSDKPAIGYRVEDFAADVVPLLDGLGIEQAVVAGHSGSCLAARRVAIDHPERVAGLVLEASPTTHSACWPPLGFDWPPMGSSRWPPIRARVSKVGTPTIRGSCTSRLRYR